MSKLILPRRQRLITAAAAGVLAASPALAKPALILPDRHEQPLLRPGIDFIIHPLLGITMMMRNAFEFGAKTPITAQVNASYYSRAGGWPQTDVPWTIEVPQGATHMRMHLIGASGGAGQYQTGYASGCGGYVYGTLAVVPGESFDIYVGGAGQGGIADIPTAGVGRGGYGGWPNGGHGTFGDTGGGGGGGRTEVRRLSDGVSILIAGGGGGGSGYGSSGGPGGGTTGGGTLGGTQSATPGSEGSGGNRQGGRYVSGTEGTYPFGYSSNDGGGGGDGWYGGGLIGGDGFPGGGGSGYIHASVTASGFSQASVGTVGRPPAIPDSTVLNGYNTGIAGKSVATSNYGVGAVTDDGKSGYAVISFNISTSFTN